MRHAKQILLGLVAIALTASLAGWSLSEARVSEHRLNPCPANYSFQAGFCISK